MVHLLMYDIDKDSVRTKVVKACEEAGLERVQFSAFWGEISDNECEQLLLRCREIIGEQEARIHILPLCARCFKARQQYATGAYEGQKPAPRDRGQTLLVLPDLDAAGPSAKGRRARRDAKRPERAREAPAPTEAPATTGSADGQTEPERSVDRARADVARRIPRRNRPVGTDTDPWEGTDG